MKYIKLFESFSSHKLPNFRVDLVKPGTISGRYLFTCVDGSWNSFFGVFDIEGLKKLEDAMNTECVFAELSDAIRDGGTDEENSAFEADTTIVISQVNSDAKFINLLYRDFDMPFSEKPVSNVSNPPPGLVVGEDGLRDEHIIHGHSVTTSKIPLEGDSEGVEIDNYPIVLNELHFIDHHFSDHQKTEKYEKAFDENVGFRISPIEEEDFGMEEIEPYMRSIIDSGIPQGVLKTIKEIKNSPPKKQQITNNLDKEDFDKDPAFLNIIDTIENIQKDARSRHLSALSGEPGSQERVDSIERHLEEYRKLVSPHVQKAKKILQEWSSKLPREYFENWNKSLESVLKRYI